MRNHSTSARIFRQRTALNISCVTVKPSYLLPSTPDQNDDLVDNFFDEYAEDNFSVPYGNIFHEENIQRYKIPLKEDVLSVADTCATLKTLVVLCQGAVQEIGEITIPLPAGVLIDPVTGLLNVKPVLSVVSDPILNDIIIPGKVINYGWVHVLLTITGIAVPVSANYAIPLQGHLDCPAAVPGDNAQHTATLEGTVVYGTPTLDPVTGAPTGGELHLKAVYRVNMVVAREELVDVQLCQTPTP